jgi:Cu(I)/Ag(I) efflux system membrane fusion protein
MSLVKRSSQGKGSEGDIESLRDVSLSPSQRVMANVSTEPARRRAFVHKIAAVGVIDFAEPFQAKVSARFRGRIEKLYVNFTGEVVRKGQPLFDMYSPDLVSAERDYVLALNSIAGRQESGADTAQTVQQEGMANAARDRLRVHFGMTSGQIESIASTRQASSTVTFTSPIQGTVVAKEVQEGQYVDEGMLLYQLADLSKVWAYLDVYEKDVRFIKPGQMVAITADAHPGESFDGRVAFIDPEFDSQTRTVRVRVELNNAGGKLKPQMYIEGEIRIPVPNSLVVMSSAVLSTGKRDVVWIEVKPNVFESRDVVAGLSDGMEVQILRGLHEGDLVATRGGFMLDSESQLQQPVGPDQAGQ